MRLLYIVLVLTLCSFNVVANSVYQSFINDGKSWHYAKGNYTYCYKIKGDTIIDNQTFSKLYRQDAQYYGDAKWHYFAALKESDKKVYIRYADAAEITLLHDFGIDRYDEYMMPDSTYIRCNYRSVEEIKGISRNVYGVNPYRKDREENPTLGLIMVEGIGFESHIDVFDTGTWMQLHPRLERCYEDNMLIYGNSNYTPLVREGVKWECVLDVWKPQNEVGPNYFHYPYTISFDGDTIINGKNYKKCFYQFADNDVATSDIPRAFVREDLADRKVYCIDNIDFQYYVAAPEIWAPDREYLLYDFANPTNKEQFWCIYDSSDTISSAVEIGGKQLNKHVVFGISLIESIGYAGNGNDYENYCFHGDLLSPMIGYRTCLCETSYPTFRRFVDENRQAVYSLSRVEIDESYIPLVREGVKWNCVLHKTYSAPTSPEEQDVHSFYSIKFDGDTIINGITYKKCYYVFDDANEPSNIIPRAFVREDVLNKKVYVIYNGNYTCDKGMVAMPVENDTEYLLYDFEDVANNDQIWCNYDIEYFTGYYPKVGNDYWIGFCINGFDGIAYAAGIGVTGNVMAQYADLLTHANEYVETGGVYIHPQFLNMEDAEGNIIYTASEFNQVEGIAPDDNAVDVVRYDLYGRRLSQPAQGVNIVKMSDGTTRKEMVK